MTKENNNSGDWNSGNRNSGKLNSGDWNSGNRNSGNWNSGNWNSGNRNSGNWNSGNRNSGYLNTITPKITIFNKTSNKELGEISFPNFFYFSILEWVYDKDMSNKEKEANPSYVTTGGYLKAYNNRTAWRNSWDKAGEDDRRKVLELPNFDNEIFKEISGIDANKELAVDEKVTIRISKKSLEALRDSGIEVV